MCYAYPGPRCTDHAKKALIAAILSDDKDAIKKAKNDFC
jgi:hypothetical protein